MLDGLDVGDLDIDIVTITSDYDDYHRALILVVRYIHWMV